MQKSNWVGLRERDNFAYTKGGIPVYGPECRNSLIISDLEKGVIEGVSNQFLIQNSGKSYSIPITKVDEIMDASKEFLNRNQILIKFLIILDQMILIEIK